MPVELGARARRFRVALLVSLELAAACEQRKVQPPIVGNPIPEIVLPDLEGDTFRLSGLRGKVVVVNFWASWCPPCVEEMPSLEKLYRVLKDKGLEVVGVSVDDSLEVIERFRNEHDLTFTILHDKGAKVSHRFQTFKYPESYVSNREGVLVAKIIGPRDWIAPAIMLEIVSLLKSETPASGSGAR